jgi:hypothetical protein
VQGDDVTEERRAEESGQAAEVLVEDMFGGHLIVTVGLLEKAEITLESIRALEPLDLILHDGEVARHGELLAVVKVDLVVRVTLDEAHALLLERRPKVRERLPKELGQQKE